MRNKENRKEDIVLVLKPIGSAKHVSGLMDKRLFTGDNNLHAVMDTQTCLWSLRYDHGILPQSLKQKFTGYAPLIKYVTDYLKNRNIEITEVKD